MKTEILLILILFVSLKITAQDRTKVGEDNTHEYFEGNEGVTIDKDGTIHLPEIWIEPKENSSKESNNFNRNDPSNKPRNVQYSGEIRYSNDVYYSGKIMNDKPHGQGTLRFADGSVYTGNFEGGIRNGQGKVKFSNKDGIIITYEGEWSNDMWHGEGIYDNSTFTISGNVFKGGRITGENARIQEKGQTTYIISGIKDGKLHGISTLYNSGGSIAGKYEHNNGDNVGMVFTEKSLQYINEIKEIKDIGELGGKFLAAFSVFTTFSIYDKNALVFVNNVKDVTSGTSEGQDFFNMIAIGIKNLNEMQINQIKKQVNLAKLNAYNTNNKAEQYFWKNFEITLKIKSGGSNPGFLRN